MQIKVWDNIKGTGVLELVTWYEVITQTRIEMNQQNKKLVLRDGKRCTALGVANPSPVWGGGGGSAVLLLVRSLSMGRGTRSHLQVLSH